MRRAAGRLGTLPAWMLIGAAGFLPCAARAESPDASPSAAGWQQRVSARLEEAFLRLERERESEAPGFRAVAAVERPWAEPPSPPEPRDAATGALAGILRSHGLPEGLVAVVAVESRYNPAALSPRGARGLWQLMPETARRYGLKVEPGRDERLDPIRSTHAAARYLKDLHAQFADWPLVLAAYHAGEHRVERAMKRLGASDFWMLARFAALPEETRAYVPAVLSRAGTSLTDEARSASAPRRVLYAVPTSDAD